MKLIHQNESGLAQYSLYEIKPKIYAVVAKDDYERAMLFMRVQEYYESPFDTFRGKDFCFFEYMNVYRQGRPLFTYTKDWAGYNVPSDSVEKCMKRFNDEPCQTPYDEHMMNIISQIRAKQPKGKFYLLGVDSTDSWIMDHEMAHALYFTNSEYKAEMTQLLESVSKTITQKLTQHLVDEGYPEKVIADEIQAYLSTGLNPGMDKIRGIKTWQKKFSTTFKKYNVKSKSNNSRTKRKTAETV
jgi:hypothetical protein